MAVSIAFLLLAFLCGLAAFGRLPLAAPAVYLAASSIVFILYGVDKAAAHRGQWRTPENTLHILGLIGGWPGALIAQKVFRHKSRKRSFQAVFWVTVILNCAALAFWSVSRI